MNDNNQGNEDEEVRKTLWELFLFVISGEWIEMI
jgi:hypothetical protein